MDEKDAQNPVVYPRGSVAMANSGPDTNGSQFFLNYDDSELAPSYTYFATITDEGMKTMDKIAKNGVEGGQPDGKPAKEVKIKKATVKACCQGVNAPLRPGGSCDALDSEGC